MHVKLKLIIDNQHCLLGIDGERGGCEAHAEETADAVVARRCSLPSADTNGGAERRVTHPF